MHRPFARSVCTVLALVASLVACGSDDENAPQAQGAGGGNAAGSGGAAGSGTAGTAGSGLAPFTPPADPGPGKFLVTVSGEDFALNGFPFKAGSSMSGDPAFVDGWSVKFTHIVVTYGDVVLNEGPDTDPNDKSKVGKEVGRVAGPFAVDLAKGGPVPGKGGPEDQAVALGVFDGAYDGSARYALSYATTKASAGAKNVNLDAEGLALYQTAIEKGWAVVYVGTATFTGGTPAPGSVFEKMPKTVEFTLGLANPTRQLNCENPDLGKSAIGEDFARGVQPQAAKTEIVQITHHTDHLFWDRLEEEEVPLHFDIFAARSSGYGMAGAASGKVGMADLEGVDITQMKAKNGDAIPFRSLVPDYTAPGGTLAYDPNGVSITGNSLVNWLSYTASASGHLNADGECLAVPDFSF